MLRGNLLFYSEKKGDKEPIGVIILEGCTVELAEEETEHYAFKVGSIILLQQWPIQEGHDSVCSLLFYLLS